MMSLTSVASLRRCPTSPESVPHFSGIRIVSRKISVHRVALWIGPRYRLYDVTSNALRTNPVVAKNELAHRWPGSPIRTIQGFDQRSQQPTCNNGEWSAYFDANACANSLVQPGRAQSDGWAPPVDAFTSGPAQLRTQMPDYQEACRDDDHLT